MNASILHHLHIGNKLSGEVISPTHWWSVDARGPVVSVFTWGSSTSGGPLKQKYRYNEASNNLLMEPISFNCMWRDNSLDLILL